MSEAGTAVRIPPAAAAPRETEAQGRVAELKVSGHLMTLDSGLFCVFQVPGSPMPNDNSGLPGVRISLPPGTASRPDEVTITPVERNGLTIYELRLNPSDVGRVIGRQGMTINAIRSLLTAGSAKKGLRCTLEIVEEKQAS